MDQEIFENLAAGDVFDVIAAGNHLDLIWKGGLEAAMVKLTGYARLRFGTGPKQGASSAGDLHMLSASPRPADGPLPRGGYAFRGRPACDTGVRSSRRVTLP